MLSVTMETATATATATTTTTTAAATPTTTTATTTLDTTEEKILDVSLDTIDSGNSSGEGPSSTTSTSSIKQPSEVSEASKSDDGNQSTNQISASATEKPEVKSEPITANGANFPVIKEDTDAKKRKENKEDKVKHLNDMKLIEEEYALLKDRLFNHRLAKVDDFLQQVREGILPRFVQQKKLLQAEMKKKLATAEVRKSFRVINLDHQLTYSTKGAKEDYEDQAKSLKRKMIMERRTRLKKMEREKREMDRRFVPAPDTSSPQRKGSTSKVNSRRHSSINDGDDNDRRKKRKSQQTSSPLIVYMLSDRELHEDLNLFGQPLKAH